MTPLGIDDFRNGEEVAAKATFALAAGDRVNVETAGGRGSATPRAHGAP